MRFLVVALSLVLAFRSLGQIPRKNSDVTPAYGADPAHHHQAYPDTQYGISGPGDCIVWVNTRTGVYQLEGERWFGRAKEGQYECEKAALAAGDRETRNGQ